MTKSFKELQEATGNIVKNVLGPAEIRELKVLAKQLSAALQPDVPAVLAKIEAKLQFLGYTLGEIDLEEPFDEEGEDDYFILTFADQEVVKNCYITLGWEELDSALQVPERAEVLRLSVDIAVSEVSPEEIQALLDDELTGDDEDVILPEDDEGELDESVLSESAFRIKAISRNLSIEDQAGEKLSVTVNADGSLDIGMHEEYNLHVPKQKAEAVIQAIQDHFVKFTQ